MPHGVPSDDIVSEGDFFTFDIGSIFDGYHSDTTRTVAIKSADEEMKNVYDIVLKAQLAVLGSVKPGAKCSDVDKIARDIISENGYGKYFGHATGHGVGLDIHESPVVSPRSETILKKGMMITVKHYVKDGYINTDGIITEVDNTFKRLRIVRTYINYDDIDDITGDDIVEPDF